MERAERVGQLLLARGWKVSVAEATAGGLISAALLKVAGASRFYERGIVAYSKAAKLDTLGMPPYLYSAQGSVHREAVKAMAEGARRLGQTQVGVSESGVAGHGAGNSGLPLGTVWAAVVTPERELQRELHLLGNRVEVMEGIVDKVLEMLEEALTPVHSA